MNQKFETLTREGQLYEAPFVSVVDIHSEGLLCASTGSFTIPDWEHDGDESLDF